MIVDRIKIVCEIEVNLDPVPGWGNTPTDFVDSLRRMVSDSWTHYHPRTVVDHIEKKFMVTYGGPDEEQTHIFEDLESAVAKHTELIGPLLEEIEQEA